VSRITTLAIALMAAACMSTALYAPQAKAAGAPAACQQQVHHFYNNVRKRVSHTIDQNMPNLGEISSCIKSLINSFDINTMIYVPSYETILKRIMNKACAATKGEINGVIGSGPTGGSPPGGPVGRPPTTQPPGGSHPPVHTPPGGNPTGDPPVVSPPGGAPVQPRTRSKQQNNVWDRLLSRYGAAPAASSPRARKGSGY
jgi:hypothetical protein